MASEEKNKEDFVKKVLWLSNIEIEIVKKEMERSGSRYFVATVRVLIREWAEYRQAIADGRLIWKG